TVSGLGRAHELAQAAGEGAGVGQGTALGDQRLVVEEVHPVRDGGRRPVGLVRLLERDDDGVRRVYLEDALGLWKRLVVGAHQALDVRSDTAFLGHQADGRVEQPIRRSYL